MRTRIVVCPLAALLATMAASATETEAQQTYHCVGVINGIQSMAIVQVEAGGHYTNPHVVGQIQNQTAAYGFTGELFGGTEGYVSLVEASTGERIDRVWIGLGQAGFALRTEDGGRYDFLCGM